MFNCTNKSGFHQIVDIITEFQTDRIAKPLERWCHLWQGRMSNLLGGLQVWQGGDKGCQGRGCTRSTVSQIF